MLTSQRGLSLLEVAVGLAISAVIMLGVFGLWQRTQEAYLDGAEAADAQQNLRVAIDRITKVVLRAGHDPTAVPIQAFAQGGDTCVRVLTDVSGPAGTGLADGLTTAAEEDVTFNWVSGSAELQQTDPVNGAQVVAQRIVANPGGVPVFQFFNGSGGPLATGGGCGAMTAANLAAIRLVRVTLSAQIVSIGQTRIRTIVSDIRPRNLN